MRCHWKAGLFACALALLAAAVYGDGIVLNGVSSRSLGRGGTNLGHFDNGGILHDNPAAMTNIAGTGLVDVGVVNAFTHFNYSDPDNPAGTNADDYCPLPQVSYIRKSEDEIWAWGFGIFTPAGFSQKWDMNGPFPLLGQRRYQSYGALMKVLPGLSCQVTDRLSIGGTFGLGVSYASLEGPYFLQNAGAFTGVPTNMTVHGTGATPVWSVASQYLLTDATTLGATYTSVSNFNLDGNTSVTIPGLGSSNYKSTLEAVWPQSVGLGVRQELTSTRVFSTDVIWYDWSSAFNNFNLTLTDPTTPGFPPLVEKFPLRWRDSISTRIGLEQKVWNDQTLRLGYVHHRIPVPDATLTPWIQATLEHAGSVGWGTTWNGWNVDLGYMYLWGPTRNIGTSSFIGGDFDNSRHIAQVHALFFSFIRPF